MKLKIIGTLFLSLLSQSGFCEPPPKPNTCPSVSALQAGGISFVEKYQGSWFAGVLSNNYGTNVDWTFVIGEIKAANEKEARTKAVNTLSSLTYQQGPISSKEYWVCLYNNKSGYTVATVTPPPEMDLFHAWMKTFV